MRLLPQPTHTLFWILLALCLKGSFFLYKTQIDQALSTNKTYSTVFAHETDDARSYFEPIENFLSSGNYGGGEFGDYRMPGYGIPYAVLRTFFSPDTSVDTLVVLQLMLAILSVYILALIAFRISSSSAVFYWTYFLFCLSTYTSLFDHFLLTESLATSCCIFGFYYFTAKKESRTIVLSGFFFAWALFLKPIIAPILLIAIYFLLSSLHHTSFVFRLRQLALFLLPVLVFEVFWINHNYSHHHTFSPLTRTTYYPKTHDSYRKDLFDFLRSTGQTIVWWNKGTLASYFLTNDHNTNNPPFQVRYAFTSQFNGDSLVNLKKEIDKYEKNAVQLLPNTVQAEQITNRLKRYTASVREEKPILYYLGSRLRLTKSFLLHSGTYNLFSQPFSELTPFQKGFKILYSGFYLVLLFAGLMAAIYFFFSWKNAFLSAITLYLTLVYPLVLQLDEYRYLVLAYPFLLLLTVLFFHQTKSKKNFTKREG